MAEGDDPIGAADEQTLDIRRMRELVDMLDQRLDNIDSVVTAVVERVMSQPVTLNITCPHCGKNVEITMIGKGKPTK